MKIQLKSKLALSALLLAALGSDYYYSDKSLSPTTQANVIEFVTRAPASSNKDDAPRPKKPKEGEKPAKSASDDASSASEDTSAIEDDDSSPIPDSPVASGDSSVASSDTSSTEAQTLAQQLCETHSCSDDDVKAFSEALGKDKGLMVFARMLVSKQEPARSSSSDNTVADNEEKTCSEQNYDSKLTPSEKKIAIQDCEDREKKAQEELVQRDEDKKIADYVSESKKEIDAAVADIKENCSNGDYDCQVEKFQELIEERQSSLEKIKKSLKLDTSKTKLAKEVKSLTDKAYNKILGEKLTALMNSNPAQAGALLEKVMEVLPENSINYKAKAMDNVLGYFRTNTDLNNPNRLSVDDLLARRQVLSTGILRGLNASPDERLQGLYKTTFMPEINKLIGLAQTNETTAANTTSRTDLRGVPTSQAQVLPANQLQQLPLPQTGLTNTSTFGAPIPNSGNRTNVRGAY